MTTVYRKPSPFLDSISDFMTVRRYSKRTVRSYIYWIRYFIVFQKMRHPHEMGAPDVEQFLTFLAVERKVSVATQKVALNALAFLYNRVLEQPLGDLADFNRASRPPNLPVVLTRFEVARLLLQLKGVSHIVASILYGSGLRRAEAVRLRIKDIDFDHHQLQVWNGKGYHHRLTTLAPELVPTLEAQIEDVRLQLRKDSQHPQFAGVWMPDAHERKYRNAGKSLGWQYLFPSARLAVDPQSGFLRRHHINDSNINRALKLASQRAKIEKHVTSHTLRHSFATHLCSSRVRTFVPYRSNWATGTSRPPKSIPTC